MPDVAHIGLHVAQMTSRQRRHDCFDVVTVRGAKVLSFDRLALGTDPHAGLTTV